MTAPILLVEDNPITCKLVRYTLETEHYEVVEARDGADARTLFRARKPGLVLLDLLLPDVEGFDLLNQLRALPDGRDVPILAFSGMLSAHDQARLAEAGFDDVVSKPIEPSRLVQIVRGYVPLAETMPVVNATARTLVVADDDAVQRKMVALRLQRAGYKVIVASDGQDALDRTREHKPYAVVSDVLMPRLDGFGLCMAVRNDAQIADTPIILISNSYLDEEDKSLAARVGADDMLVRTPDLREVLARLDATPMPRRRRSAPLSIEPEIERERIRRMMNQLERQGALHASLTQRCSMLSAELSVLSGISVAVATQDDLEGALHQILAACFDAGGISLGMLYLSGPDGIRGVPFGHVESWHDTEIASFFGHVELLATTIRDQTLVSIPSPTHTEADHAALLGATTAKSLIIAPLGHRGQTLGALVTMSRTSETQSVDAIAFAQAVAGQISLALALARSFQAKDASERTARANETVLRSILDSMAEGVHRERRARGAVTHWNHAASTILGLEPAHHMADQLAVRLPLTRALGGVAVDRAEVRLRREHDDGWLSVNARPLGDDAQTAHGGVAVFRDVTVERAAHARMLVSERMASLGTLAAGVGHEINNPLMAVLGNIDMAAGDLRRLQRQYPDLAGLGELADELRDAREAGDRVRNIVRDLKLFSHSDEESRGEVRVEQALESSIRMVWNEIRHRAKLVRDYKPVPPVYANESRLGQVFLNLIVNAAQAIPDGRANQNEIRVVTSLADDGRVRVEITDSGSGMPPEVAAQLFTPFFTTKPIGVGTGLGLSICHQLVTAVGGEIVVETELGKGTTFTVLFPALAPSPPLPRTTTAPDVTALRAAAACC